MKRPILGLVLAGGASRRLGRDKALLRFREGENQLDWTLRLLEPFCERLAISCQEHQKAVRRTSIDVELVVDDPAYSGPLAGVIAGLRYAAGEAVLAVACDMPLLDASAVAQVVALTPPESIRIRSS